ncbi:MAG: PspA/IM30 family protein [Chloroflexota bacterium]|nr:PspA/IM30 family protein [Chloroflexota bacterium]
MGILDRISTVLRTNINALLDASEDPRRTLEQVIRDMAEAIAQARGQTAEVIAQEKLIEADYLKNHRLAQEWERKTELALTRGSDDLAREALRRKIDFERNAEMLGRQLAAQQEISAKLKRDLTQLEAKYDEAIRNRDALVARHRTVLAQQQVARSSARLNLMDPSSELARMEARIRGEEARTAAYAEVSELSLDKRLDSLETDIDLDLQLADMKARLRGELPAPDPAKAEAQPEPTAETS